MRPQSMWWSWAAAECFGKAWGHPAKEKLKSRERGGGRMRRIVSKGWRIILLKEVVCLLHSLPPSWLVLILVQHMQGDELSSDWLLFIWVCSSTFIFAVGFVIKKYLFFSSFTTGLHFYFCLSLTGRQWNDNIARLVLFRFGKLTFITF